ncbi:MAG: transglutaminase-like domain-containing protein [Planctomycetaceae bacterium]
MQDETTTARNLHTNLRTHLRSKTSPQATEPSSSVSCRLAYLLAFLATLTLEIAAADGERPAWTIALTVVIEASVVFILSLIARRFDPSTDVATRLRKVWILCLAMAPFIAEILIRGATNTMLPLELLLLALFRNGVLSLAVFSFRQDCQKMCCSMSTFLIIFASAVSSQFWLHGLVVAYAIVGIWWLMGSHWESLQCRLAVTSKRELSRGWLIVLPLIALLLLAGLPVAATQSQALRGFMPSSGGTDWYGETARSGVGDGDNLIAGTENIQSFAPIENAPFLSSHEPSLYDLFDDMYNEPVKMQKLDRSIALSRESTVKQQQHHLAESKVAGRQFSTLRKPGEPKKGQPGNRDSNALFYVKGRVPLHLKLEVFDRYDGIEWFPEPLNESPPKLTIESLNERPWLRLPRMLALEVYSEPELHAIKIIRLDTNRIPSPPELLGIHIDKLDRADFYTWAQPGIVRMDRDKLPSLTVMHLQSRVLNEQRLSNSLVHLSGGTDNYRQFGCDERSERVRALAKDWARDAAHGWPQVQAIVARLKQEYVLDRDARPSADCDHTVADFLFETRRGPDYQFASAAVMLLRSLGYSARLVTGFYVEPARYQARGRHTPVLQDDVHFWVEVFAGGDNWIPVEPTPGYQLLQPHPTLIERISASFISALKLILSNAYLISLGLVILAGMFVQRHFLADQAATVIWRLLRIHDDRGFALQTLRLLDRRCRRVGRPRPCGTTPTRWLQQIAQSGNVPDQKSLFELTHLAEWAAFAPHGTPAPCTSPRDVCLRAVDAWSWKKMSRTVSADVPLLLNRLKSATSFITESWQQTVRLTGRMSE